MNYAGVKMKLTDKILNWLDKHGRKRIIMDREYSEPYLERYYIFLKDRKKFRGEPSKFYNAVKGQDISRSRVSKITEAAILFFRNTSWTFA